MATILLTHAEAAGAHYYDDAALARLRELGEVRLNESGRPLATRHWPACGSSARCASTRVAGPLLRGIGLRELGEVRLNESGRPLATSQLIALARGCEVIVSDRATEGPAAAFEQLRGLVAFVLPARPPEPARIPTVAWTL
jgi:hypothetical protein